MSPLQQTLAVTAMNLRSVKERKGTSLVAVVGIAGVVAVLIGIFSINEGFRSVLQLAGSDDVAIVLRGGGTDEMTSGLSQTQTRIIGDAAGVARVDGEPVASAELYVIVDVPLKSTGTPANVPLRGVGPKAASLRRGFRLLEGRMFTPGTNEVIVGRGAALAYEGLDVGAELRKGDAGVEHRRQLRGCRQRRRVRDLERRDRAARRLQPRDELSVGARAARERRRTADIQGRA